MISKYVKIYQENDPTFRVDDKVKLYDADKYHLVYKARLNVGMLDGVAEHNGSDESILNALFELFNCGNYPEDYKGHSMSVGDIVVLSSHESFEMGSDKYICASFGWNKIEWKGI